ncbi:hypothetical protein J7J13_02210 [bacterium]|nr:hypothetical protein [bacterium]
MLKFRKITLKQMEKKTKKVKSNSWKEIVQIFVANMITRASGNISEKIQEWFNDVKRKTIGLLFMSAGVIFVLICLAIYINTIVDNESQWAGYGAVGAIVFLVGYFMARKRK